MLKFTPFYFNSNLSNKSSWLIRNLRSFMYRILGTRGDSTSHNAQKVNFNVNSESVKVVKFFDKVTFITTKPLISLPFWTAIRISFANTNWIYTTNHKRIGINYFNFVLVSGTAGMGLASLIRIELSYPGIGVLCGDSIQYLTLATGHGVIMVFFMIMPTLFGAFANFLLPTQLGVHDVAFPRLNSAAFWFLPGGLIMLFHIVCTDRRYQKINYFNIREMETLFKRKYFNDLINTNDYRKLLNEAVIGLRFKSDTTDTLKGPSLILFDKGITTAPKSRPLSWLASDDCSTTYSLLNINLVLNFLNTSFITNYWTTLHTNISALFRDLNSLRLSVFNAPLEYRRFFTLDSLGSLGDPSGVVKVTLKWVNTLNHTYSLILPHSTPKQQLDLSNTGTTTKNSGNKHLIHLLPNFETSSHFRWITFNSPQVCYSSKGGNYAKNVQNKYPNFFFKQHESKTFPETLTAPWYLSSVQTDQINQFFNSFKSLFNNNNFSFTPMTGELEQVVNINRFGNGDTLYDRESVRIQPLDNFLMVLNVLNSNVVELNNRAISVSTLNHKYQVMFNSFTTQQRLLSKWRELKFTREAWRCKLLIARNQNLARKRNLYEGSTFWSIERNARDLIPGWAMVTPFSARVRYTLPGKTDMGLIAVFLAINASIISSANFLVTYRYLSTLNNRKMRDARSFFSESIIVASWMMIAANPMLAIGILMLLSDRHWRTCFFDYSGGGDTVLFQHMFWFFGHPEVYVIMIPVFGFTNTFLSYYLRKRISARASLIYSLYTIAFLGFWVWGHHMYMVGLSHTTRMLFSTLTVMISVPAATKLMHWCVTIVNSAFIVEIPLLYTLAFIFFFVSGGISGMCVAHTGMDVLFHDTFYVIGHFHVMLAGAGMLGIFGAFYFYFPSIYGVKYSRIYASIHFIYYLLGQILTVVPMMWLGYCGMPRRVFDYPYVLGGWHSIATSGHLLSVAAILSFFVMIYDSVRQGKAPIRTTFGVARFNTRFNFFSYELSRTSHLFRRGGYLIDRPEHKTIEQTRLDVVQIITQDEQRLFGALIIASRDPATDTKRTPIDAQALKVKFDRHWSTVPLHKDDHVFYHSNYPVKALMFWEHLTFKVERDRERTTMAYRWYLYWAQRTY